MVLPDPGAAPDEWTRRSLALRFEASINGKCSECGSGHGWKGIDHREIGHVVMTHEPGCRCGDEVIREHLDSEGLVYDERLVGVVVDLPDSWAGMNRAERRRQRKRS
jgi:hypothetical protein